MQPPQPTGDSVFNIEQYFPQTEENRAALRTAIATIVAILLAFSLHLEKPYWSGMTVVMLSSLYTGNILDKAIMRLLGTVIGAFLGFFLAGFVANSLFIYLMMNFLLIAISVYYYNSSRYAYAYLMIAIGAFIVISELAIAPEEAFLVAVWRPIEICLGVVVSAVTAFCLFPNAIQDHVIKEIHGVFAEMDNLLAKLNQLVVDNEPGMHEIIASDNVNLKKNIRKAIEKIDFMRREVGYSRNKIEQCRFLLDSMYSLSRMISYFLTANSLGSKRKLFDRDPIAVNTVFLSIRDDLRCLQDAFFADDTTIALQTRTALANFDASLTDLGNLSLRQQKNHLLVLHFFRKINSLLFSLSGVLIMGKDVDTSRKSITHQQQLRNDPDIFIHGIKAGLTAVLALAFWLLSNWPGGLNGIVSSIVISLRRNLFDMKNIGAHRLLGCLLGGGIFFSSLYFFEINLYLFVMIIFFSVWGFSFFSFKYTPYAYIGLQANIALVIAMARAGGPPTDIAPPLERLGGVVIGITASLLVANLLWRTDLLTMLFRQLAKIDRSLNENCKQLLLHDKKTRTFYDVRNAFWVCRGLLESLEKDHLNPAKQARLTAAKVHWENLILLQVTIVNVDEHIDQEAALQTAKKCHLDLKPFEIKVAALYAAGKSENKALQSQIEQSVVTLVGEIKKGKLPLKEIENCVAYLHSLQQLNDIPRSRACHQLLF